MQIATAVITGGQAAQQATALNGSHSSCAVELLDGWSSIFAEATQQGLEKAIALSPILAPSATNKPRVEMDSKQNPLQSNPPQGVSHLPSGPSGDEETVAAGTFQKATQLPLLNGHNEIWKDAPLPAFRESTRPLVRTERLSAGRESTVPDNVTTVQTTAEPAEEDCVSLVPFFPPATDVQDASLALPLPVSEKNAVPVLAKRSAKMEGRDTQSLPVAVTRKTRTESMHSVGSPSIALHDGVWPTHPEWNREERQSHAPEGVLHPMSLALPENVLPIPVGEPQPSKCALQPQINFRSEEDAKEVGVILPSETQSTRSTFGREVPDLKKASAVMGGIPEYTPSVQGTPQADPDYSSSSLPVESKELPFMRHSKTGGNVKRDSGMRVHDKRPTVAHQKTVSLLTDSPEPSSKIMNTASKRLQIMGEDTKPLLQDGIAPVAASPNLPVERFSAAFHDLEHTIRHENPLPMAHTPVTSESLPSRDPFMTMDAVASHAQQEHQQWIAVNHRQIEVAVIDDVHGVLHVRAEKKDEGGVQAMVMATSEPSHTTLKQEANRMADFLGGQTVSMERVQVVRLTESSGNALDLHSFSQQERGRQHPGQRSMRDTKKRDDIPAYVVSHSTSVHGLLSVRA